MCIYPPTRGVPFAKPERWYNYTGLCWGLSQKNGSHEYISPTCNVLLFILPLARANILRIQDVEKSVRRIFRQFAFLKRLKRSGRGHDPAGVNATAPGETAVLCWACPHDGMNLPAGWRDVDKKFAYVLDASICAPC